MHDFAEPTTPREIRASIVDQLALAANELEGAIDSLTARLQPALTYTPESRIEPFSDIAAPQQSISQIRVVLIHIERQTARLRELHDSSEV